MLQGLFSLLLFGCGKYRQIVKWIEGQNKIFNSQRLRFAQFTTNATHVRRMFGVLVCSKREKILDLLVASEHIHLNSCKSFLNNFILLMYEGKS
jgi:hypothetical protein